jgi:hypothetical protein
LEHLAGWHHLAALSSPLCVRSEGIADDAHGLDQARMVGIWLDLLAQAANQGSTSGRKGLRSRDVVAKPRTGRAGADRARRKRQGTS